MTLLEASKKWRLSVNWIRALVKSGRVPATLRTDVPVPFYDIPQGTPKPGSMRRAPARLGSRDDIQPASMARRARRARRSAVSGRTGERASIAQ
jgi:hypothetical protein